MTASAIMRPNDRGAILRAQGRANASLARLSAAGIGYVRTEPNVYCVAGTVTFFPLTGYWRANDNSAKGYDVGTLIRHVLPKGVA
jgi:hypothetical protein